MNRCIACNPFEHFEPSGNVQAARYTNPRNFWLRILNLQRHLRCAELSNEFSFPAAIRSYVLLVTTTLGLFVVSGGANAPGFRRFKKAGLRGTGGEARAEPA